MLGTPALDADEDKDLTIPIRPLNPQPPGRKDISSKSNIRKPSDTKKEITIPSTLASRPKEPTRSVTSPTKSILLTPGTATTRRKTVSFGDSVIDNERKPSVLDNKPDLEPNPGKLSRQWCVKVSEVPTRKRSKFTQSLMDSRERTSRQEELGHSDNEDKSEISQSKPATTNQWAKTNQPESSRGDGEQDEDDTTNLEIPHSRSGIYWKSEYESYRQKTETEIKKLIEYRSFAKSYAKKKEAEASRLTDKLKEEEAKVAAMERRVSELAAGMMNGDSEEGPKKDEMVRELSRQTAAAVQYKQKAATLRKMLEQNGVVGGVTGSVENSPEETTLKLREVEQALKEANTKLKATSTNSKLAELEKLVETSEQKASELQAENLALKRSLARFKGEMSKYEERRKAKEARLKQREQKLEFRLQEYSSRLKTNTKVHRESEEAVKQNFAMEKKQMQQTINSLKLTLIAAGHPVADVLQNEAYRRPSHATSEYLTTSKKDSRESRFREKDDYTNGNLSSNERKSNSPSQQELYHDSQEDEPTENVERVGKSHRLAASERDNKGSQQPRKTASNEPLISIEPESRLDYNDDGPPHSPNKSPTRRRFTLDDLAGKALLSRIDDNYKNRPSNRTNYLVSDRLGHQPRSKRSNPKLQHTTTRASAPGQQRPVINSSLDLNRRSALDPEHSILAKLEALSDDRISSAKARLKRKKLMTRKIQADGKENMITN
ncbi:hypothetical protein FQN57_004105 [Myotisia sp. PD_48]|nr:hypothetical protein FQN57_004105 [Myotisia sp. PD_48]